MRHRLRKILLWTFALSLVVLLTMALIGAKRYTSYTIRPALTKLSISYESGEDFIDEESLLEHLPFDVEDSTLISVHLAEVENLIFTELPYTRDVNAYISPATHSLNIHVTSREPILRFLQAGKWYFMDSEGKPMPTRLGASAHVPVAVGNITEDTQVTTLYPLASYIAQHTEWQHFFGLIDIKSARKIHLYPRVGDYIFELQGVDNLDEALDKIPLFYQKIVPQLGSNQYKIIKLSYRDQIVCKKRN